MHGMKLSHSVLTIIIFKHKLDCNREKVYLGWSGSIRRWSLIHNRMESINISLKVVYLGIIFKIFIDREAREIMHLVASVRMSARLSVCLFVCLHSHGWTARILFFFIFLSIFIYTFCFIPIFHLFPLLLVIFWRKYDISNTLSFCNSYTTNVKFDD